MTGWSFLPWALSSPPLITIFFQQYTRQYTQLTNTLNPSLEAHSTPSNIHLEADLKYYINTIINTSVKFPYSICAFSQLNFL